MSFIIRMCFLGTCISLSPCCPRNLHGLNTIKHLLNKHQLLVAWLWRTGAEYQETGWKRHTRRMKACSRRRKCIMPARWNTLPILRTDSSRCISLLYQHIWPARCLNSSFKLCLQVRANHSSYKEGTLLYSVAMMTLQLIGQVVCSE